MTSEIRANTLKNRVGLGTISLTRTGPIVSGISTFSGDVQIDGDELFIADSIKHVGDTDTIISFPSNDTINFRTGGSERLRIESNGRIAVGGFSGASNDLHIKTASSPTIRLEDTTNTCVLLSYAQNSNAHVGTYSNHDLIFDSNSAERLRITSGGLLQATSGQHDGGLELLSGNNNQSTRLRIQSKSSGGTAYNWYLDSARSADRFTIHDGTTSWFTILGSGNIGINDTSPDRQFHVNSGSTNECARFESTDTEVTVEFKDTTGTASLKCRDDFRFNNSTGEMVRITSGGALLLGTSTRSNLENFHVHTASSDKAIIKFTNTATGTGTGDGFEFGLNSNEDVELMLKEDKNIIFGTGSTLGERLRINSSGQVGIGTNLPRRLLHLTGGAETVKIQITNAGTGSGTDGDGFQLGVASDGTANIEQRENKGLNFATNNTERFRIDNTGRLIAGGTSAGPYHQDGDNLNLYSGGNTGMSIFSGTSSLGSLFFADGNNDVHEQRRGAIQYNHNGDYLTFWTNAGEKLRIASDGDITASHSGLAVNIFESTDNHSRFRIKSGSSSLAQLEFADQDDADAGEIRYDHGNDRMTFHVGNNGERLRIDSDAKFMFGGATAPVSDFEIRKTNNGGDVAIRIGNNTGTNVGSTASLYFTTSPTQSFNTAYIQAVRDGGKLNFGYSTNTPSVTMHVSQNKVGIANTTPECRSGGIDMSCNDGTSGKTFTDMRGYSNLIIRNPNTDQHGFTQLLFENGGGTSAATMFRHRLGPSHGPQQNFVGDLCLFRRTGNAGGSNNDFRESTRFCGATEQARQIWWASGDTDVNGTSRLGWHHLSASRDQPGTDAYTFFRLETGAAAYARNGFGKYTCVWTTGHASGYGIAIGHFGYYMHHGYSTIVVNEHIIHRERYSNGSYYGWSDTPNLRIINNTASGGTNAAISFRCGGRRSSGFDMGVVVGLFIDLYVPESANGDTNPRLYVAGDSESNLSGGGHGNPVSHAYMSIQSSNPNHSGIP